MKQVFYKYPLDPIEITDEEYGKVELRMGAGARIVSVQSDNKTHVPTIWALCVPDEELVTRTFLVHPTGSKFDMPGDWTYIGTVQTGPFVWHIAEFART